MESMGAMLHSLNTRIGTMESAAASDAEYMIPSDCHSMQVTGSVAALPTLMVADMLAPLPDVSDAMRAQVTRHLRGAAASYPLTDDDVASNDQETAPP